MTPPERTKLVLVVILSKLYCIKLAIVPWAFGPAAWKIDASRFIQRQGKYYDFFLPIDDQYDCWLHWDHYAEHRRDRLSCIRVIRANATHTLLDLGCVRMCSALNCGLIYASAASPTLPTGVWTGTLAADLLNRILSLTATRNDSVSSGPAGNIHRVAWVCKLLRKETQGLCHRLCRSSTFWVPSWKPRL